MGEFIFANYVRTAVLNPLAERVVKLGVCAHCHKKALRLYHTGGDLDWYQCRECLHVYMLPEEPRKK